MNKRYYLRCQDLVNNPTPRIPICLCLDTSGSMCGAPIDELNEGIRRFYEAISEDATARDAADICIVTFGGDEARCEAEFNSLNLCPEPPTLHADGLTPMGEALQLGLDQLAERKQEYRDKGVDYYQPWLVLMTDGAPNGNAHILEEAIRRMKQMEAARKLTIFPIGIGSGADMATLARVSGKRPPLKLKGLNFPEFFEWLSKSVARTSQSIPGETVALDFEGIRGWAEL